MRTLTDEARRQVQQVIDDNMERLQSIASFFSVEPGFPIVGAEVLREPAIIVYVSEKSPQAGLRPEERAPRKLNQYRVAVMQADPHDQLDAQFGGFAIPSIGVQRAVYTYRRMRGNPIDEVFTVKAPMLCHVGPDGGYPVVLEKFLKATQKSLAVAIYDFSADYIAETLVELVRTREVKIALNWDDTPEIVNETDLMKVLVDELASHLDSAVVKTGSGRRFANSYHEKVAVRDSKAFWLSSGNWTENSQPKIEPIAKPATAKGMYSNYNREWHVIVDDKALAKVFEKYIKYDLAASKTEARTSELPPIPGLAAPEAMPDLFVPIDILSDPALRRAKKKPVAEKTLPNPPRDVEVQPVLTPDNYLKHLLAMLTEAKSSVYIQIAYITYSEAVGDEPFTEMLKTLGGNQSATAHEYANHLGQQKKTGRHSAQACPGRRLQVAQNL